MLFLVTRHSCDSTCIDVHRTQRKTYSLFKNFSRHFQWRGIRHVENDASYSLLSLSLLLRFSNRSFSRNFFRRMIEREETSEIPGTELFTRKIGPRESFRAIFARGSRWLGLGRSGCKVAARWTPKTIPEICKSGESTCEGKGRNEIEAKETELTYHPSKGIRILLRSSNSPPFLLLSLQRSIVVGIGRRNNHYKTLVEIVTSKTVSELWIPVSL